MLHIRDATEADAAALNAVSKHLGYRALSEAEARATLAGVLAAPDHRVHLAEHDGQVVGWIHVFLARRVASPPFHEIGGLVVDPAHRRCGVGAALVAHAHAEAGGTVRVRCRADRSATHRFYAALGFTESKTQCVFSLTAAATEAGDNART
ncbi:MAG: GNAT family N-acetyltransferase [Pseudomonadota bacterium]